MLPVTKVDSWRLEQAAVWIATRDSAQVARYPFARLVSGINAIKTDLAKANDDSTKAVPASGAFIADGDMPAAAVNRVRDTAQAVRDRIELLEAAIASAIEIPVSVLLELQQALHSGQLSAYGDIDGATKAPIPAAIWLDYQLAHIPLVPPAQSMTPAEKMPLTLRAVSYRLHPSSSVTRKAGPAHYEPSTRGTLHYRMIENIVVDRAAVMRLWPAPGASRKPKTSRPGQAKISQQYIEAKNHLVVWFLRRFNRPPQPNENDASVIKWVMSKVSNLTDGTARRAWTDVKRDFAKKESSFHREWLRGRGRPKKRSISDSHAKRN